MFEYIIIGIIFILLLIIIFEKEKKFYFEISEIKIEEALKEMTILLEKKLELLTKISKKLNNEDKSNDETKNLVTKISKIKNKKVTIIEHEEELFNAKSLLDKYIENNNIDIEKSEIENTIKLLNDNDIEIKALKLFYNNEVEIFNMNITKIKNLLIKKIKKYKKYELFTIQQKIEFEILKEEKK